MRGPIEQLVGTSETTTQPIVASDQRGHGQRLSIKVRVQIVKNLQYLACLEKEKTNPEQ